MKKTSTKTSTIVNIVKIIRAFLVCKELSIAQCVNKADTNPSTTQRVISSLVEEGILERHPKVCGLYVWVGDRK